MELSFKNDKRWKLGKFLPIIDWLPKYDKSWFRLDILAGITLAAFSVPELMAFSELAGLPPEYGLYAGIFAAITYFFFGTIKQFVIGPSSAQAIMVAGVIGVIAVSPEHYLDLAMATAILVGIIFIIARILRLGFIVDLIPVPVMKGYLAGVALVIISGQLYKLFGIESGGGNFFEDIGHILVNLGSTNVPTLALGLGFIGMLLVIEHRWPKLPASLIVVIVSIIIMSITNLEAFGVKIIGEIRSGLPVPRVPAIQPSEIVQLLPLALGLFLLSYVESMSIGRNYSKKRGYKIDENQEMVAIGTSNIAVGLFQGFPISGSFSRTAINVSAGAKTPISILSSGIIMAIVALFLTGLFFNMPQVIIPVLVIVAVYGMIDVQEFRRIRKHGNVEFFIAIISLVVVLMIGVLMGVVVGVVVAFLYMGYRIASPSVRELGRTPGMHLFWDLEKHPGLETIPGVKVLRVDAPLLFANSANVQGKIMAIVNTDPTIETVILDMETSPMIDVSATDMLLGLHESLDEKGIAFYIARPTYEIRESIKIEGWGDKIKFIKYIDPETNEIILIETDGSEETTAKKKE